MARGRGLPFLVAIDGRSGVGKSTFADALCQNLDASLVSGDDFFAGGIGLLDCDPDVLADICIDRQRLLSVLKTLKSNRAARYAPFDWDAFDGSLASPVTVRPAPFIVLEGVYAHHPDLRKLVDYAVLLTVPLPERERRLQRREGEITAWERQWHRGEAWYFYNLAHPDNFNEVIEHT